MEQAQTTMTALVAVVEPSSRAHASGGADEGDLYSSSLEASSATGTPLSTHAWGILTEMYVLISIPEIKSQLADLVQTQPNVVKALIGLSLPVAFSAPVPVSLVGDDVRHLPSLVRPRPN